MQCQKFKYIILGASSSFGLSTISVFNKNKINYKGFYRSGTVLGFSKCLQVENYMAIPEIEFKDTVVLDFRGWTDIFECERMQEKSLKLNFQQQFDLYNKYNFFFKKYFFISSASVEGNGDGIPISKYAEHKLKLENTLKNMSKCCGLRIHSTYGPFQKKLFVYECTSSLLKDGKFQLKGSSCAKRDLIHQDCIPNIFLKNEVLSRIGIIEILSGKELMISEIAQILQKKVNGSNLIFNKNSEFIKPQKLYTGKSIEKIYLKEFVFPYKLDEYITSMENRT
jgi:hypothetical protein